MIALIAAMAANRVIGRNNRLPWNIPEEIALFKAATTGKTVIMGRKTFEGIGHPLPQRNNIVVSRSRSFENVLTARSLTEAVKKAQQYEEDIFVIGGASLYALAIPLVDKMYLSTLKKDYDGDALFPEYAESEWETEHEEDHTDFVFRILVRKR